MLQVMLSSISASCACSFIGAAAVFSNSSGESTLGYNIICQCKNGHLVVIRSCRWMGQYGGMHNACTAGNHGFVLCSMRMCIQ